MILNSFLNLTSITESTNVILVTSWCKFPFYEVDFRKPVGTIPLANLALPMGDMGSNGVEVYIFLEVKDVPYFEEALDVYVFMFFYKTTIFVIVGLNPSSLSLFISNSLAINKPYYKSTIHLRQSCHISSKFNWFVV